MTWVYPEDEAATTTRLGLTSAAFWVAVLFIADGVATLVTHAVLAGAPVPVLGLGAFAGVLALLICATVWLHPPRFVSVLLIVMAAGFAAMLGAGLAATADPPVFAIVPMLIATTALGGIADQGTGAGGTIAGYALAQLVLLLTTPSITPEPAPGIIAAVVALFYGLLTVTRRRGRSAAGSLDDAARVDLALSQRRAFELRSRALVHDTVLSELVAIGMSRPGAISETTRSSIIESLDAVRGRGDAESFAARPSRALGAVLERERRAGLEVDVTGDPSTLDELPPAARAAMLQAIDQALVNVRKHAGVAEAELSVSASGASIVATIVDDGVGFSEADIPQDRFGFRESIRGALEAVGGTARILSSPNAGTSVVLTVPQAGGGGDS